MLTRVKSPIPYPRDEQERSSIPDQLWMRYYCPDGL
jgi:hypothetical protein